MKLSIRFISLFLVYSLVLIPLQKVFAVENILSNPSFENGLAGWDGFWSREAGKGSVEMVSSPVKDGNSAVKIIHQGSKDWSFSSSTRTPVKAGEVYSYSAWVKSGGGTGGSIQLSFAMRDKSGEVIDWMYGLKQLQDSPDWTLIEGRILIPSGCDSIQFRFTGDNPSICSTSGFCKSSKNCRA